MSYHIESGNVLFGTANVPAYAFVTTGGGLLQLERPDGNAALLEIDGNIQTGNVTLLTAATAGVVATDSANALTSTAYDATALGNASYLLTGILPSARLTGPYANTTELDIQGNTISPQFILKSGNSQATVSRDLTTPNLEHVVTLQSTAGEAADQGRTVWRVQAPTANAQESTMALTVGETIADFFHQEEGYVLDKFGMAYIKGTGGAIWKPFLFQSQDGWANTALVKARIETPSGHLGLGQVDINQVASIDSHLLVRDTTPSILLETLGNAEGNGSTLTLTNNANAATRTNVALGSLVQGGSSTFTINALSNTDTIDYTMASYDFDANRWSFSGDVYVSANAIISNGGPIENLDASKVTQGTVPDSRVVGSYAGLTGLTITDASPTLAMAGTSAAQYSGPTLRLENGATLATRKNAALGTYVQDADGNGSYFAIDALSNTNTYDYHVAEYAFSSNQWTMHGDVRASGNLQSSLLAGANLLVSDAGGNVAVSGVTATEAAYVSGVTFNIQSQLNDLAEGNVAGINITGLDANNLSWGTVPNARLTGNYDGFDVVTAAQFVGNVSGDGSSLTALNASQVTTGTVANDRLSGNYTGLGNLIVSGTVAAATLSGNGGALTGLDASAVSTGTLPSARLSGDYDGFGNVSASGAIYAANLVANGATITAAAPTLSVVGTGTAQDEGSTLRLQNSAHTSTRKNARLGTYVRDADGNNSTFSIDKLGNTNAFEVALAECDLATNAWTFSGNVAAPFFIGNANASNLTTGTVPNARLSGTYSGLGAVTATSFTGDGSGLTALNATQLTTGTVPNARLSGNYTGFSSLSASGTIAPSTFSGGGSLITGLDASALALGTVPAARVLGAYSGFTDIGASGTVYSAGLVSNVVTVSDSIPTFSIAPTSTAQYTGSIFRLQNNADASTRKNVSMGTAIRDADGNTSYFSMDKLSNTNTYEATMMRYDLGTDEWTLNGKVNVSDITMSDTDPLLSMQATATSQYSGPVVQFINNAHTSTRRGVGMGSAIRDADGNNSYFYIDALSNANVYLASLASYDLSDHRWSFKTSGSEALGIESNGNLTLTGSFHPASNVTYDLGRNDARWNDLWLAGSTVHLGSSTISESNGNVVVTNLYVPGNLNVSGGFVGEGISDGVAIANVQVADSGWNVVDDTAVALSGGYILVNGTGFAPASIVKVDGTNATATSYVSSTQLRAQIPAKSSGTYNVSVVRPDTKTATLPSAVSYSDVVTWVTTSPLDAVYQYLPFTTTLQATSDSNVVYANTTALPSGVTLNASTGVLDGNILTGNAETLYSFDVKAEDEELQDAARTFLMQYYPFAAGKISASDYEANSAFGISCAISADGTRAIVGAYDDDAAGAVNFNGGAAYIFSRSGSTWTQEQKLIASDSEASARFGVSCAISSDGTRVIVGARADDAAGGADSGGAYVFSRSGTTWTEEQKLVAGDSESGARFGQSCAISSDGSRVIVGAWADDATGGTDSGAAYIFSRSGTTWTQEQKLIASDSEASAYFGWSCAISNDGTRAIVGARDDDASGGTDSGAAYIFSRSGTSWSEETKLVPSDSEAYAWFGISCSISSDGSRVIVGASADDATGGDNSGAAYIFSRSGTSWSEETKLVASDSEAYANLGFSCGMDATGSRVIVGARTDDAAGGADSGACYIFSRTGSSWSEETKIVPSDSEAGARFGQSCWMDATGARVIVGAPYDDAGVGAAGAAYLFQRTYAGWKESWP